ncbi:MAG: hypothetical protein WDO73_28510 [Ignavibacteriota bacterium]
MTTTTRSLDDRSPSVNVLPDRNGTPAAAKYPSLTTRCKPPAAVALPINLSDGLDSPRAVVAQWQHIADPSRQNAGDRAGATKHLVDERVLLGEAGQPETGIDPQRGCTLG